MSKKVSSPALVTTKIKTDTLQKIKVIASIEKMTMIDYLEWLINKAYESAELNNRKHNSKKTVSA